MNQIAVAPDANVTTNRNDSSRTGAYLAETSLRPANVNTTTFGRLYERAVEGDVMAQPLYLRNVSTASGQKNLLFIATSTNHVYAFDLDETDPNPAAGVIWDRELQPWRPLDNAVDICLETIGTVGVTSTPVIDVGTGTMFVVTRKWTTRGAPDDGINFLHAIDVTNGTERPGSPVQIQAQDPLNTGVHYDSRCQRQRPGLLLLNGVVYMAFGTFSCDAGCPGGVPYHGWVLGYRASDLTQVAVFCTSRDGGGAGIWQSGSGIVGAPDGSIWFETGNETATAPATLGDCFVRLQTTPAWPGLALAGSFRPSNWVVLKEGDTDVGSGGPMLLPGGRLIGGGKQGRYYVLDANNMTLTQDAASPNPTLIGEGFQAFKNTWHPLSVASYAINEIKGPNIHGCPIYWPGTNYIYQMPEKDFLKAFLYDPTTGTVTQTPAKTAAVRPPDGMPGGFSSISANGNTNGIVWTIIISNGDGQWNKVPAIFVAFDATTLQEIWRDQVNEAFSKFCPPTIADGKVIRPTSSSNVEVGRNTGKIIVYGLL